jgi:hypothetical protein
MQENADCSIGFGLWLDEKYVEHNELFEDGE